MSRMIKLLTCAMILVLPLVGVTSNAAFARSAKQTEAKKEAVVHVTTRGKKYHKPDCRFIKNRETIVMSEDEAIAEGLTPCGWCFKEKTQAKE